MPPKFGAVAVVVAAVRVEVGPRGGLFTYQGGPEGIKRRLTGKAKDYISDPVELKRVLDLQEERHTKLQRGAEPLENKQKAKKKVERGGHTSCASLRSTSSPVTRRHFVIGH
jgi:hypothetical protein